MLYAEVAVHTDAPYRHPFTYAVPPGLGLIRGQGVLVPFGQQTLQGVVLSIGPATAFEGEVRPLHSVAVEFPPLPPHLIDLACWLSDRYLAPIYSCVSLMLPPGVERKTRARLLPAIELPDAVPLTDAESVLVDALRADPTVDLRLLQQRLHLPRLVALANGLVRRGVLKREYVLDPPSARPRTEHRLRAVGEALHPDDREPLLQRLLDAGGSLPLPALRRSTGWSEAAVRRLLAEGIVEEVEVRVERDPLAGQDLPLRSAPVLTAAQRQAVALILTGDRAVSLLHGVTGSGKTEVYLAATASTLAAGRQVLVLVPEIALTPQTIERFAGRFPGRVAVLHSGLSDGQRYDQWWGIRERRFDVVVGSRSALFAPVPALGLIVLDEAHEWTYKQQDPQPRYQTRDAAERLATLTGARLVLGSATPSVHSYHRARSGRYQLIELRDRVRPSGEGGVLERLPVVEIVDLARELREGNRSIFSRALSDALTRTLAQNEQSILFLNRRGSASLVLCRDCGHVPRCGRCAVSLTLHAAEQRLLCHQCGRSRRIPSLCPQCRGSRIRPLGLGTQRVEDEVARRYPAARVLRWDRDTARRAADHAEIFGRLQRGENDILIGTQMVAKGLDLPGVTLVGIVNADLSLNLPDCYSGERAFQLFTQVAGRAGRRDRPGRVIIQTYAPNSYAVRAASRHDYRAFYDVEVEYRRRSAYPPFARLTRLVYAHSSALRAEAEVRRVATLLRQTIEDGKQAGAEVAGPAPCRTARLRGRWRWQLLLRSPRPQDLLAPLQFPIGWSIDVDPESFS